ncbi:hypothetical protein [Sulfurimonas indica]|uniref:hypothetical protein n=1 Tax=Sulfurimonas TaxID=202746 RepID=UPI0012652968|nr:hypothetical protein [Sulfurimonas indica]
MIDKEEKKEAQLIRKEIDEALAENTKNMEQLETRIDDCLNRLNLKHIKVVTYLFYNRIDFCFMEFTERKYFKILRIHNSFSINSEKSNIVLETHYKDDIFKVKEFIENNRELLLDSMQKKEECMLREKKLIDEILSKHGKNVKKTHKIKRTK